MDHTNVQAKVALRKHFLTFITQPHILECFAGEDRILFNACYQGMDVTAMDTKQVKGVLKIDNRKFIASQDLSKYNFFDLDAYGSPYELLLNIFHKKQHGEPFVVVLTDGLLIPLIKANGSTFIQTIIKFKTKNKIPGLERHRMFIIKLILKTLSEKYNILIQGVKLIQSHGVTNTLYLGMLCKPKIPQNSQITAINA